MIFKKLIQTNIWSTISTLFLEIYPKAEKDMAGYKMVYEKLLLLNPEETGMSIVITKEKDCEDEYIDVSGVHNNPTNEEENYSQGIEFKPWQEWLGMDVSSESLNDFSELEIIVHCLYEMTFVGFTEEAIQERIIRIEKSKKERKLITKEESDAVTTSIEELLSEWRDDLSKKGIIKNEGNIF